MERIDLGGLDVSAQGLGCMGMSEWYGPGDWDQSIATIHRALELGVTFLDTANVYGDGHNEVLVGRGIAGHRDEFQIATKFGIDRSAGDANRVIRGEHDYVKRQAESSLLRLGIETIDVHPDEEWSTNLLVLNRRRVLLPAHLERTAEMLSSRHGVEVAPIEFREMLKNGGGLHCSTMELEREWS